MFLTGEEEEEWAGDTMVLGDEDAHEEVLDEAALAAAVRAAVAEAKYQSLLDAEERRLELLKVAARPLHQILYSLTIANTSVCRRRAQGRRGRGSGSDTSAPACRGSFGSVDAAVWWW